MHLHQTKIQLSVVEHTDPY